MQPIWVLVADNSQASMYHFQPHQKQLRLLDRIQHEEGRWHNQDFITDGTGHGTTINNMTSMANRGLGTTDRSPKNQENTRFTQQIAEAINNAYDQHSFESLQICAPPKFLGELLPKLKKSVPLSHKVPKDMVHADSGLIMQHLNPLTLSK
ncbi:host attachment protein [Sansalvadorimonas sp. 2012CJ34-2]|uniref:Host attachment protein n=1 Tax=Parendozoicomonas callyspongiae TaxID=2942213 RepID=A0ABT0PDK2_9GAMM|nr:host attachment protein [Sansalvadorimonas sp. 2012CJ34-2]MCL6269296.1 host attachment protein [Sansalvadorimonas sp. 2012CJ34-2]